MKVQEEFKWSWCLEGGKYRLVCEEIGSSVFWAESSPDNCAVYGWGGKAFFLHRVQCNTLYHAITLTQKIKQTSKQGYAGINEQSFWAIQEFYELSFQIFVQVLHIILVFAWYAPCFIILVKLHNQMS